MLSWSSGRRPNKSTSSRVFLGTDNIRGVMSLPNDQAQDSGKKTITAKYTRIGLPEKEQYKDSPGNLDIWIELGPTLRREY